MDQKESGVGGAREGFMRVGPIIGGGPRRLLIQGPRWHCPRVSSIDPKKNSNPV